MCGIINKAVDFTGDVISGGLNTVGDVTGVDAFNKAGEWVETQFDYIDGDYSSKANDLKEESQSLENEVNAFQDNAQLINSRYTKESFLYKDNASFKFVTTSSDLKYLKYIYPEKMSEYEDKIDELNKKIAEFQDRYDAGFLNSKDLLGDWLGGIVTNIAVAIGNVVGFLSGKNISGDDALKSFIALVVIVLTIWYAPELTAELIGTLGVTVSATGFYITMAIVVTLALDSTFGGSQGLIEVLNVFGQMFDGLGLTDGSNIFNKFFDSFKKDSDYNGYLVFAVQSLIACYIMPSFETMMAGSYATLYAGYNAINAVDSIIKARKEYQEQKEEYEKKMADMQKKAIDTERDARLSKLSNSMIEGDDIVKGTWWNQYAGMQGWMTFDRPNGLFFGIKDSPDDIMFKYDLYAITHPNIRNLGVMPERLT